MTQPATELVDPGSAFLASGDPERFLTDNLPSATEPESPEDHKQLIAAVAIAGAFMAWRLWVVARAREEIPSAPVEPETALAKLWARHRPIWLRIAEPVVTGIYQGVAPGGMTSDELQAVAADYAASLGDYIHRTSADAVLAGYREALRRGISPTLAWLRAIEGYGLEDRRLRGWVAQQAQMGGESAYGDLITPGARRALERAMLLRADALGQNEAWHARHLAKSIAWMHAYRRGELPVGTMKRWVTADDERVCKICGPLHLTEAFPDQQFTLPNGQRLWAPGVHPNCRCELELVHHSTVFEKADWNPRDHPRDERGRFTWKVTPYNPNPYHKQVSRRAPGGEVVQLDEGMANLVPALWRAGMSTRYSCEGPGDRTFEELEDGAPISAYVWISNADRWDALKAQWGDAPVLEHITDTEREDGVVLRMESRYIEPLARLVSSTLAKAAPGDPYDRDRDGQFARQESRNRKVTPRRLPVKEREEEPAPVAEEVVVDPFAVASVADPFASVADPFASVADSFATVTDPFVTDPFVKDPFVTDPFATDPFARRGRKVRVYILVNGELKEVEAEETEGQRDDFEIAYLPVDLFYAQHPDYAPPKVGEPAEGVPEMYVGKVIDFDDFSAQAAFEQHRVDRVTPKPVIGFFWRPAQQDRTELVLHRLDDYYHFADDLAQDDERFVQSMQDAEEMIMNNVFMDPNTLEEVIENMDDGQIAEIYLNAGMRAKAVRNRHNIPALRHELVEVLTGEDTENSDYEALAEAFNMHIYENSRELEAYRRQMDASDSLARFRHTPMVFTFRDNSWFGARHDDGAVTSPMIMGKYRVVEIRKHFIKHTSDEPRENPRIPMWREVVLEQVAAEESGEVE